MFTLPHRYADKNGNFPIVRLSDKVARVWVDEVGVEFTLRPAKVGVLVGLPPVVAPQGRAARVALPDVDEVLVGPVGGETAVLAHKDLGASLAVGVLLVDPVDLPLVGLQGAALREGLFAQLTPVGPDTWDGARESETLYTE